MPPESPLIAADVMTPFIYWVRATTPLGEAIDTMLAHRVRHLPVVDASGALVGMLAERDVRTAVGDPRRYSDWRAGAVAQFLVGDVMSTCAISVPFDRPVTELARAFVDDRVGAFPVLDRFGALIGIVSYIDVLRAFAA